MILINRIPDTTSQQLLHDLVIGRLDRGQPVCCDILRIKEMDSGLIEYHGLIKFDDENDEQQLLVRLQPLLIADRPFSSRTFCRRSASGGRRVADSGHPVLQDRRQLDDRRRRRLDHRHRSRA